MNNSCHAYFSSYARVVIEMNILCREMKLNEIESLTFIIFVL